MAFRQFVSTIKKENRNENIYKVDHPGSYI
jgi:hypothetical protein